MATASCTRGGVRHRRCPYSQPASRLAQLDTVNSKAAVPAASCSTANAVTAMGMAPKNPPRARVTPAGSAKVGRTIQRPARWRSAAPAAGGAVRCCAAKHSPPATTKAAASIVPAAGYPLAPRMLTRTGPARYAVSLTTDSSANAAGNAAARSSRSSAAQRAADSAPSWGMLAPTRTPPAVISQSGTPAAARASNAATAPAWASSTGGSTRVWPKRSISRASCGPATASATANPPVTSPAAP